MALFREDAFRKNLRYLQIMLEGGYLEPDKFLDGWSTSKNNPEDQIHFAPKELLEKRRFLKDQYVSSDPEYVILWKFAI